MEKMKQNKNTSVIIRVASATLAAVFLFCTITIPSYADNSFNSQPLPLFNNPLTFATGKRNGSNIDFTIGYRDNNNIGLIDVYAFLVPIDSNTYNIYVSCSKETEYISSYDVQYKRPVSYSNPSNQTITIQSNTDENLGLYYSSGYQFYLSPSGYSDMNLSGVLPIFNTLEDGLSAVSTFINSSNGTVAEFNYSIKPGYALFIDIHGLSDVSGTLFTNTSAAYASPHTSNQTLSYQSSLPGGNVSPQGNGINWQGTGNKDLFGRYKSWNRSLIIQPNSHYIAIYNPVHINTYVDPEHEDFNGSISVHLNKAYSETSILVPLNTELTGTGTVGTITTEEQKPVVYDENTNTWVPQNSDGTPYTESPYGDYLPSTTNSIHDWLQNIANLISGFFNGAIGAVTTLVGAGSAFINQLVSLYSWLPAPVYAVLSSALILVITIGVIKVFI